MKRLILTRHAKSSWDDPLTPDHDRPLNDRGKAAAADLGQWLASRGYIPDEVLCSDALRTRMLPFARAVNAALDACGFPLCKGNIMAGNADWCLSLEEWRRTFSGWVANTDPPLTGNTAAVVRMA